LSRADIVFTPEAEPWGCWFVGGFVGLLGLAFVQQGLSRLGYAMDVEGWFKVFFGLALAFIGWRGIFYYRMKTLHFTNDTFIYRPFWSLPKRIPYTEIESVASAARANKVKVPRLVQGRVAGMTETNRTIMTTRFVITTKTGRQIAFTAPRFDPGGVRDAFRDRANIIVR
jgi:hypothetical protein